MCRISFTFADKIAVRRSEGAANAGGSPRQVSLQVSGSAKSAGAQAETSLRSRAGPHPLNEDSTALGTLTGASQDRDCWTRLQGLGTAGARPGSLVRGLWSLRFPGITAGCFWQGPRNEASPTDLCLALREVLRLLCLCWPWAQSQSPGAGKGLPSLAVCSGLDTRGVVVSHCVWRQNSSLKNS